MTKQAAEALDFAQDQAFFEKLAEWGVRPRSAAEMDTLRRMGSRLGGDADREAQVGVRPALTKAASLLGVGPGEASDQIDEVARQVAAKRSDLVAGFHAA